MDKHELICRLKDLALELGRTPTRREFLAQVGVSREKVDKEFGTFSTFVTASGLELARKQPEKITNAIFEVDIERHLESYEPRERVEKKPYPRIAILGDLHEPFSHEKTKQDFKLFCEKFNPNYIVQIGDAMDAYSNSKFPRSHNVFTPKEEESLARKRLEEMWTELHKAVPCARRIQLLGNHDIRVMKRVLESLPSIEHWAEAYLKDLMTFDNVETIFDTREEYLISDIAFIHGYQGGYGSHSNHLMRNVVCGHLHKGSVVFRSYRGHTMFELNVGFAADPESKGLTYTPTRTTGWTLGWGAIDEYGPRFIPR